MNFVGGVLSDLLIFAIVAVAVVILDVWLAVRKRRKSGGEGASLADFAQRRHIFILLPIAIAVAVQQNVFAALGFQTRDDVPYVLGFFGVVAILAFVLVQWAKKQP